MHRDKVCRPAEEQAAELIKVDEYLKLLDRFTAALKDNNRDLETYELSGQILSLNPEHYTVWNRRRSLMVAAGPNSEALVSQDQGLRELEFTLQCFKKNPKSYWIWCHRRWVLLHMPSPPWRQELAAAAHILSKDARNFHAWDYRQWVVKISRISTPLEELEYTTSKIRENFSNYSAWHYRSTLIPQAFKDSKELGEFLVKDLELVRNAVYTEPNDQSSWFYQRWLLSSPFLCDKATLEHELTFMKDLIDLEPNCAGKGDRVCNSDQGTLEPPVTCRNMQTQLDKATCKVQQYTEASVAQEESNNSGDASLPPYKRMRSTMYRAFL